MIAHNPCKNLAFIASILLTTTTYTMKLSKYYQESAVSHYFQRLTLYYQCESAIRTQKPLEKFPPQLDLELTDTDGTSLLHVAVDADHHEAVTDFLKKGANPNQKNIFHITPLHLAIENQSPNCCIELIQHGATKESMYVYRADTNSSRCQKLYTYKGQNFKKDNKEEYSNDKKKYFAFMAPVLSALLTKELMPLYRKQQEELTIFTNFILRYYLCQYHVGITPIREYLKRQSELQEIRYLIIRKLLEISGLPIIS